MEDNNWTKTQKSFGSWGGARGQWLQAANARNFEAALKASRESWHSAGDYHDRDTRGSAVGATASHRHEPVMTATAKATKRSREASANANRSELEEDEITLKVGNKTIVISEKVRDRVMATAVSRDSRAREDEEEAKAEKARGIEAEAKREEEPRKAKEKSDKDAAEADRLRTAEDDARKGKEKANREAAKADKVQKAKRKRSPQSRKRSAILTVSQFREREKRKGYDSVIRTVVVDIPLDRSGKKRVRATLGTDIRSRCQLVAKVENLHTVGPYRAYVMFRSAQEARRFISKVNRAGKGSFWGRKNITAAMAHRNTDSSHSFGEYIAKKRLAEARNQERKKAGGILASWPALEASSPSDDCISSRGT